MDTNLKHKISLDRFSSDDSPKEETPIDSINKASNLFTCFKEKPPTLQEALYSMGCENIDEILKISLEKGNEIFKKYDVPGITPEDIAAIFCYTFEWGDDQLEDVESPYKILNKSLSVNRESSSLKKTRYFLFLLLQALRKLPKFIPDNRTLYRGIATCVQTKPDKEYPKRKPYVAGNEKIWWTFASTTINLEITKRFVGDDEGTLFTLSGETWGYDISMFSNFSDEKEILLEPERKLRITSVSRDEGIINVNAMMSDTPLVLKDVIEVGKTATFKKIKSNNGDISLNLKVNNITDSTMKLSWDHMDKAFKYQISVKKVSNLFKKWDYETNKEEYTVENLEMGEEYEFYVRCNSGSGFGKGGEKKRAKTKISTPKNFKAENVACESITLSWDSIENKSSTPVKYIVGMKGENKSGFVEVYSGEETNFMSRINPDTEYYFRVCAERGGELSEWSELMKVKTRIPPPNNVKTENVSWDSITISWDPIKNKPNDPVYYMIKMRGENEVIFKEIYRGRETYFTKSELCPDTNYLFQVRAMRQTEKSEWCKAIKERTKIFPPKNIKAINVSWDSITISWDPVKNTRVGSVSYTVEMRRENETKITEIYNGEETCLTKSELYPDSEYLFRALARIGDSKSQWSNILKVKTQKILGFSECTWKECPNGVESKRKYSVDIVNSRIARAKKGNSDKCSTVIGNTPLPSNKVTSWYIKILKSKNNDGLGIYIGVAPFDIDQNKTNRKECGWYFNCFDSTLCSGPPHNYSGEKYGPKERDGQYVHMGDTVGVVMDTSKDELSFYLNGVNYGVAYKGIPLDKPLVPCVLLKEDCDSVELDPSETKENVDSHVLVPSNITSKIDETCDSIILTWNTVYGASFYQVEVNCDNFFHTATTNAYTEKKIILDNEYSFRVRTVKGSRVSKWSNLIKVKADLPIPGNVKVKSCTWNSITISWDLVLSKSKKQVSYKVEMKRKSDNDFVEIYDGMKTSFTKGSLLIDTEYCFRVRSVREKSMSKWSDNVKVKTMGGGCWWKECPDDVDEKRKYLVDINNRRIATNIGDDYCTIVENTTLPLNSVVSWSIKIIKSKNDGNDILIGVAPFDINRNEENNYGKCGWYFYCYTSTLYSGPPRKYRDKKYGPRKEKHGEYVHDGDSVGVVMDTTKGELSFVVNDVNLGVAYEEIPLDKPLVPCVIIKHKDSSVELDLSEVKETRVNILIPVPSNIIAKSETWDSITLSWDAVKGASFYQVEVDETNSGDASTINLLVKNKLHADKEYSFRVRTVKSNSVGKWSDVIKVRTVKKSFETSGWKKCPDDVDKKGRYSFYENNTKIVTKIKGGDCTIIGNTQIPSSKVTSWNIKIIKSRNNNGGGIVVGVAPYDIDQNNKDNIFKCGWYFNCYRLALCSGPPHNYKDKEIELRKNWGKYVHTGYVIGVVMDTIKGDLSIAVNGVDIGILYKGIPLDKPLVPCVLLRYKDDSVEFDTSSEMKERVDISIPVPSSISTKSDTWDSITLTWGAVGKADYYHIEVDESKFWDISTTNTFTKSGLLPESIHSFKVRVVKGNSVGRWSDVVKGKPLKALDFSKCVWEECPGDVDKEGRYSVDRHNKRIATKLGDGSCTIIGNTPLPLNALTSWGIQIVKSRDNNGGGITIGVAPSDIDQNSKDNIFKCGWYFYCYRLALCSGPPHKYKDKELGQRENWGKYVHTGSTVSVAMNTSKGELSFVVSGVSHDITYKKVPLDKPLVPCVLLKYDGDSVGLVI